MTQRRSYAGGANILNLVGGISSSDVSIVTNAPLGWPDGLSGPFAGVLDKGEPTEEKVLLSARTASTFTVSIRGYDGTTARDHSPDATFQMCLTAIDLDEANAHGVASAGVHGLPVSDVVVGRITTDTLRNKSLDGAQNTFTNIPQAASPQTVSSLATITTHLGTLDGQVANRYTKAESDALLNAETAARTSGDAAVASAASAASAVLTAAVNAEVATRSAADSAETAARIAADALLAPIASPTFTGTVTLPADGASGLQPTTFQQVAIAAGKGGVFTGNPDVNGNITIAHGLGVVPGHEVFTPVGPAGNGDWLGIFIAVLRSKDSGNLVLHCFHTTTGSAVASGSVTVSWHVWT